MILFTILLFILARSLYHDISPIFTTRMAALALIFSFTLTFNALYIQIIGSGIGIYCGLFTISYYNLLIESFIYLIGSIILLSWGLIYTKDNSVIGTSSEAKDYSLICLFSILGSSFLISSGDLLSMYLSIELQSFGLYILATIYRESGNATNAGLKYFLLGGLSSCLILLGTGLIYSVTGLTDFNSIYSIVSVLSSMPDISSNSVSTGSLDSIYGSYTLTENFNLGLNLGFIFIIVGFLFKIAAAPFHNWSPDVYDESPTNVTIWLTIMPKIAIFLFLLEIYGNTYLALPTLSSGSADTDVSGIFTHLNLFGSTGLALKNLFLLSSLLSLIIGTVVGLAQIRIKRLFAYSTISHVGFLLLALAIKTEQATESFLFYLIQYTITNLNAFFILLAFGYIINNLIKSNYITSDIRNISELKGQFASNPILSLSLSICLFSMAGIPPLIGFFGKQSVLLSAIGNGYYFMAIVAIVVSVISASYYLRIIKELQITNESPFVPLNDMALDSSSNKQSALAYEVQITTEIKPNIILPGVEANGYLNLTNLHAFIIALLTLTILLFVFKPSILLNSVTLCTLNYFYL